MVILLLNRLTDFMEIGKGEGSVGFEAIWYVCMFGFGYAEYKMTTSPEEKLYLCLKRGD